MKIGSIRAFSQPINQWGFFQLFLATLLLLVISISIFIRPDNLDASDFMLIAWIPGQELLQTGSVYADYPYPLWTVVVMLPFVVWTQKTAMLLFFLFNLLMLAASLALFVSMFEWQITPVVFALTVSLSVFFLPVLTSLWLGQLTIFSLFILALTIYFYLHQQWTWLGIVLGLSFIKPQIMLLLAGLLLLWALWQRRWQILFGFGAVILILVLISLPFISSLGQIIGGGIGSHLGTYILETSTIWGFAMNLGTSWLIPLAISLILMLWLGWLWLPFLRGMEISTNRMFFLFSAAIMVNLIVIPYSWMHNLALLLLPLGYTLSQIMKLKGGERIGWLTLLFTVMHPLMVGLFLVLSIPLETQAFQIIPALILLPMMVFVEHRNTPAGS
jgi:hypothetical protein